jgi:4-cresol dehydrogenase (hydroxylating)
MSLERAIAEWQRVLDADAVIVARDQLARYETTTSLTRQRVVAVLRPRSTDEVREVVRIANAEHVQLSPISRGRNWGYGGRVPAHDGSVIVELSRMDRIVDFDPELAYVTVEPGVTQAQLYAFLQERGGTLWMDATTSSSESSIVGNALDRGHGLTRYADHARTVCGFEVVLGTGELVTTGYGRFSGTRLGALDAIGLGPSLDGLFVQSSFGIVTRLTVWLSPVPERADALFFGLRDEAALGSAVDVLRASRLAGELSVGPRFGNELRTLQSAMQYPWPRAGGRTPLPRELIADLLAERGASPWTCFVACYGDEADVRARSERIARRLSGLELHVEVARIWPASEETERGPRRQFARMLRGEPFGAAVSRAYWRKPAPPPADPDPERDRCGFLWCTPLLPFTGADARRVNEIASEVITRHGFEPDLSLLALRDRVLHGHISIVYDRAAAGDDERAIACHDELLGALAGAGYLPHRLGIHATLDTSDPAYDRLLARLRAACDPNDVLAPGRYC